MKIEIIATEYGLTIEKAEKIETSFKPIIIERDGLMPVYENILKAELTPELTKQAKELRLRLVKLRTSTDRIHKDEKTFFLAAGRFVDAWKNKNVTVISEMEIRLSEIENYYINLEKSRLEQLKAERTAELIPFLGQFEQIPANIETFTESVYTNYKSGLISAYNMRKKADAEAEQLTCENERKQKLYTERRLELAALKNFWKPEYIFTIDTNEADYNELLQNLHNSKNDYEIAQEQIRLENERLKKEAEIEAEKQRKELEKVKAEAAEAAKLAEAKQALIQAELKQKAENERKERELIQAQLQAKVEAELQAKREAELQAEAELLKGDAEKLTDLVIELQAIKTKYSFKSKANIKKYNDVQLLIDKIINHII